jgi:hypothetical protein
MGYIENIVNRHSKDMLLYGVIDTYGKIEIIKYTKHYKAKKFWKVGDNAITHMNLYPDDLTEKLFKLLLNTIKSGHPGALRFTTEVNGEKRYRRIKLFPERYSQSAIFVSLDDSHIANNNNNNATVVPLTVNA